MYLMLIPMFRCLIGAVEMMSHTLSGTNHMYVCGHIWPGTDHNMPSPLVSSLPLTPNTSMQRVPK